MSRDYTFTDWLCWAIFCYVLPVRWNGSRFGMWLLPRAGRYAYKDWK